MLAAYLSPVGYAFLAFPVAAMLFTLPNLIVHYRKYGYMNKLRGLLLYLFLLYLLNAVFLVLLPFPESRHNAPPASGLYAQLVPFQFVEDILRETGIVLEQPSTYVRALRERAVLQVLFNVLLTVPFGMFLRYYARLGWAKSLLASFSLALFFEITQVTGIYGYFDYPYRLFDIDDLFLNTLGGMAGFVIASWLSSLLPRTDQLDVGIDLSRKRVSYTRRAIALMFDAILLLPVMAALVVLGLGEYGIAAVIGYFIAVPYWTNGQTLGKAIVRIRIAGQGDRLTFREIAVRNGVLYGWWGLSTGFLAILAPYGQGLPYTMGAVLLFAGNTALFIHLLSCLFNHKRSLLHERASRTCHVIVAPAGMAEHPEQETVSE